MSFSRTLLPDLARYLADRNMEPVEKRGAWRTFRCPRHNGRSLRAHLESGWWKCMSCGDAGGDALALHMWAHDLGFVEAAKELGAWSDDDRPDQPARQRTAEPLSRPVAAPMRTTLSDYGHELIHACTPIHGDGRAYLEARHCALPPEDSDLRFHPSLKHPSGYTGPALVGVITNVVSGKPQSLHRTWIKANGEKAEVDPPRAVLKGHPKQGGCIRLWPDEYVTHGLAIGEGIETCLSLAHAYQPVWSLIDAGNLAALPVLPGIETLLIGRDNDPAGIRAAFECSRRWALAGCEVLITTQEHNDLNDVLTEEFA